MTEAEWLTATDSTRLLGYVAGKPTDRKLRLFACACAREVEHCTTREGCASVSELAERYADGQADAAEIQNAADEVEYAAYGQVYANGDAFGVTQAALRPDAFESATEAAIWLNAFYSYDGPECSDRVRPVGFCRDIFGNPFLPVAFSPEWRTSTAVALAQGMYESRDFGAMPILADALQDAGCDSGDVLDHCRGPGPHVRGCWVVDLVLGKE